MAAEPVSTVAVKAVLISFDFRRKDCDVIGQFAQAMSDNLGWLRKNGHPKWKAVDLDAPLKGWDQYDCVAKYVRKPGRPATATRPRAQSGGRRHQGHARRLSRPTSRPAG